jgi:NAD(P)-dependent dehydrogenase (short-subunit alcohol dehydrogenase family)
VSEAPEGAASRKLKGHAMSPKRIVITGVSQGLGRAITDEFIALGHSVAGCARNAESIAALQSQYAKPHHFRAVDVSDDTSVTEWSRTVLKDFGTPNLLINNAAIVNANAPLWDVSQAEFSRVTAININGVHSVLRNFLPAMMATGSGIIVNLSSGWGRSVSAEVAPYCASKWAIEGLTKALAEELPSGMAAIPVSPGVVNTEMLQSCFGEAASSYETAETWAKTAAPFMLGLTSKDNGKSLTTP